MSWWALGPLLWLGGLAVWAVVWSRLGSWYRSSDRDRELHKMIRKTRRKMQ